MKLLKRISRHAGVFVLCFCACVVAVGVARADEPAPDAGTALTSGPEPESPTTPPLTATTTTTTTTTAEAVPYQKLKLGAGEMDQTVGGRLRCLLGAIAMIGIAFAFSENRKRVPWRLVAVGSGLQLIFALLVLKTSLGRSIFGVANDAINSLLGYSTLGARFLFGALVDMSVPVGDTLGNGGATSIVLEPKYWATTGAFISASSNTRPVSRNRP